MDIAEIKEYYMLDGYSDERAIKHVGFLLQELEKLQRIIDDHGPDGRNYTNAQYVALRQENEQHKALTKSVLDIIVAKHPYVRPTLQEIIKMIDEN